MFAKSTREPLLFSIALFIFYFVNFFQNQENAPPPSEATPPACILNLRECCHRIFELPGNLPEGDEGEREWIYVYASIHTSTHIHPYDMNVAAR